MLNRTRAFTMAAAFAALVWCLLFAHTETTDKSMIRAILLQHGDESWSVGFLYQSPEPSADASEAAAEMAFASAESETLAQALSAAERALPQKANYRLCDYVLLSGAGGGALAEYEELLLTRQCGRLAARVEQCAFTFEELSAASEEIDGTPQALLQCAKQSGSASPRLYEQENGLVMPVLELTENGAACRPEGVLLADGQSGTLTANETQAALLLGGRSRSCTFELSGQEVSLAHAVCSVTADKNGFALRVDCLAAPAAPELTQEQTAELEALLSSTVQKLWQNGMDILRLREVHALKYGAAYEMSPAVSECPEVTVNVKTVV